MLRKGRSQSGVDHSVLAEGLRTLPPRRNSEMPLASMHLRRATLATVAIGHYLLLVRGAKHEPRFPERRYGTARNKSRVTPVRLVW